MKTEADVIDKAIELIENEARWEKTWLYLVLESSFQLKTRLFKIFHFFSKTVSDLNLLSKKESSLKVTFKMF